MLLFVSRHNLSLANKFGFLPWRLTTTLLQFSFIIIKIAVNTQQKRCNLNVLRTMLQIYVFFNEK